KEKLGTWSLSRDEVVAQLAGQGLKSSQYGWISVKISEDQRIPQIPGETYLIQSTKISGGSPWFGSFRVGSGNKYPDGAWWHAKFTQTKQPDLVFRTYVAKTVAQSTQERAIRLEQVERHLREEKNGIKKGGITRPAPSPQPPITDPVPPVPIAPPGEVVPIAPPDPPLPPPPETEEKNASKPSPKKPLLPFLNRPR
ncbi:MAG: hypothetical protein VCA36_00110, partial [Opitutales bacterium]